MLQLQRLVVSKNMRKCGGERDVAGATMNLPIAAIPGAHGFTPYFLRQNSAPWFRLSAG